MQSLPAKNIWQKKKAKIETKNTRTFLHEIRQFLMIYIDIWRDWLNCLLSIFLSLRKLEDDSMLYRTCMANKLKFKVLWMFLCNPDPDAKIQSKVLCLQTLNCKSIHNARQNCYNWNIHAWCIRETNVLWPAIYLKW